MYFVFGISMGNRIDQTFTDLSAAGRAGLFPFLVAGQGGLETTVALILKLQSLGVSGIEVGFPFTDPVADGPVIQAAFNDALAGGATVKKVFDALQGAREKITIPLVAMVSASIVYRVGIDAFLDRAGPAGFDGVIIPDLSLEEAPAIKEKIVERDLRLVMLVAPTSSPERQERIARLATGFVYYMSVTGITGERDALPAELAENLRRLKALANIPVLVGFGISRADHVRLVSGVADGAIAGSAIVRRITEAQADGADQAGIVDRVGTYVGELLTGLDA
ncbi:MAG: tryptophan synthase subunit alpha [Anaerolineales bacterium]